MTNSKRRLIGMGIPFGLAFATDTALAIRGPIWEPHDRLFFHALWLIHPSMVIAGYLTWACVIVGLLLLLPDVPAVVVTIAAVFGHVGGAYSQLMPRLAGSGYQITNGLFLLTAATLGIGLWWSAQAAPKGQRRGDATVLPARLRWGLIVLLAAAAGCIVLVPWHGR